MGVFNKYNRGNNVNFNVDVKGMGFIRLADLFAAEKETVINGIYVHKSALNVHPIAISCALGKQIDLPEHLTATVLDILNDEEAVNAIREGKCKIVSYEYESRGKKCYSVRFCDV